MKNKKIFIIINTLYVIVPLLILIFPHLFKYKFYILVTFGILIYFWLRKNNISNEDLGITNRNITNSLISNLPIIIISISIITLMKFLNINKFVPSETIYFYLFYIFISCPIQEFLYRSFYGYFDDGKYNIMLLSSSMYAFVHIIYKDILTVILTFIIGLIWYNLYRKDKNLLGVSISHCIIGTITILLGIID
mgnify:FL=1